VTDQNPPTHAVAEAELTRDDAFQAARRTVLRHALAFYVDLSATDSEGRNG
jgi:hypothetical protein